MALEINGTTGISGLDGSAGEPPLTGTDSKTGISFGSDIVKITQVTGPFMQGEQIIFNEDPEVSSSI